MKPTTLEGVGSHGEAIYRGWVEPAGAAVAIEMPALDLQNDSGLAIVEGQAVVVVDDGTIELAAEGETRPVGIALDDIDDGDSGPVQFFGPVDLIAVTASVTAGDFGQLSSTSGQLDAIPGRTATSFVLFTTDGTEPEGFLFREGAAGSDGGGGGDASDLYLTRREGEGHVVVTHGASGSALTLDLSAANTFDVTLTDDCTLSFSNPAAAGVHAEWTIILRQDGTGSWTVTWPGSVDWQDTDGTGGGAAPTLFTAATAENVIRLTTLDGGASYGGSMEGAGSGGGASELDDLTDVTITSPAEDEQLQYISGQWVNNARRWEAVTDGEDVFVWDDDDLVYEWETY